MSVKQRFFLLISFIILLTVMAYVYVYSIIDNRRVLEKMDEDAQQAEYAFKAEYQAAQMRMLQIATFVASDPHVQQLFMQGKRAIAAEGGGAGGPAAAKIRAELYEHVRNSRAMLEQQFDFHQLHFHLEPGATSFLRVHNVTKFGDSLDKIRFSIMATAATHQAVTGFETGRTMSGIRGVVPVYALDAKSGEKIYVGELEAGSASSVVFSSLHANHPWLNGAVFLTKEHLLRNVWPEYFAEIEGEKQFVYDMYLEATSSSEIQKLLNLQQFASVLSTPGHQLLTVEGKTYNMCSFGLRDFRGVNDPSQEDVGQIVVWHDVTAAIATQQRNVYHMIMYGLLLFIALELILYYGLHYLTSSLEKELAASLKRQEASDKQAQIAAESARMKNTFLAMMGHELLTPLNTIIGMGRSLNTDSMQLEQQRCIGKINLSAQRLFKLIDEVMAIVKLEDSSVIAATTPFNVYQLLQRIISNFTSLSQDEAISLKSSIDTQVPPYLRNHPHLLERVLSNLVDNAIKFSTGGEVVIAIDVLDRREESVVLEFSVTDQGIGIGADHFSEIFAPFYQVDSSLSRPSDGAGLGLHLAQKICRLLGTSIQVESSVGGGSRFSFVLHSDVEVNAEVATNAADRPQQRNEQITPLADMGSSTELRALLEQLHVPLVNLQAKQCRQLAKQLQSKRWPDAYSGDVNRLILQIENYRFTEAQEVLAWLQKML
ncbi:MAG: ATP-binding protein [Desulfuromonas sp.]|nr:ATP-binding protein [Desulfuromonas sp.]